jgi:hypothetical protein
MKTLTKNVLATLSDASVQFNGKVETPTPAKIPRHCHQHQLISNYTYRISQAYYRH